MNKQQIINDLNILYSNKRTKAQTLAYNNLLKARQNNEYAKLEKQIKEIKFALGKAQAFEDLTAAKNLKQQLVSATVKEEQLLLQMGLSKQDLSPKYACKNCHDTGRRAGKICDCYKKELYAIKYALSDKVLKRGELSEKLMKKLRNSKDLDKIINYGFIVK